MLRKHVLNIFLFYFPSSKGDRLLCTVRQLQWCIVVCCCKHPRLEAVPVLAFSQMFAAPGYSWTTSEGKLVVNTYAHMYICNTFYRHSWTAFKWINLIVISRAGMISWNLVWNGDTKLLDIYHLEQSSLLLCVLSYGMFCWNVMASGG